MKSLSVLALFAAISVQAAGTPPCKGKAIRAAMARYTEAGTIQGDDPIPSYRQIKIADDYIVHGVSIDGQNDEGETWTVHYRVTTELAPSCKVIKPVTQVKTL